ncbi:MAG TPA: hypothetical protein VEK38_04075, partial [Candidatus Bathyarchaeia archaeon]|nr:hypothetical protein [Candidatus Bathyarchaeia archaeon]
MSSVSRSFSYMFLFSILLSIPQTPLFASQPPTPDIDPAVLAQIENEFTGTLMSFSSQLPIMINHIVDTLAGLVANNRIKQLHNKNKRPIITHLQELRMLIHSILQDFAHVTAHEALDTKIIFTYKTLELCDEISNYLDRSIKKNLTTMSPFDPSMVMKRSIPDDLSFESIQKLLDRVQKKIVVLAQKANGVGLVWYNILARRFDDYVVSPVAKYNISPTVAILGLTAAVTVACTWK